MDVLWHSNAPTVDSGYGDQTRINAPRVAALVDNLTISAYYGLQGFSLPATDGIAVLHTAEDDPWGNYTIEGHAQALFGKPDAGLVITLLDYWVMEPEVMRRMKVGAWLPIDHDPTPPAVVKTLGDTGPNCIPIAMSRFGESRLRESGFEPLYVPHSVETRVLRPGPRDEARKVVQLPEDAFLVTMVAANRASGAPTRKGFEVALEAFRIFMDRHDDAYLWLHTDIGGRARGIDLGPLMGNLGYPQGDADARHRAPDPYDYAMGRWTKAVYLRALYCASDVLLAPSMGEGFGVPIIEAQACGTPVIVSDFSAMPELCGAGWKLGGQRTWTNQSAWQFRASLDDCVDALEEAYAARGDKALRKKAERFAHRYDADAVAAKYWPGVLASLAERLEL